MNKYIEYKNRKHAEFDKLPMKVAFGNKQFEQMMKEWGLTTSKEDLTKIHQLGAGCYCLKKDTHLFEEHFQRTQKELKEFLKDDDNLKSAFKYEFANHECGYTYTPQDALPPLNLTYEEVEKNERLNRVFNEAWCEYLDECE
jgi:hypothetical protein